MKDAITIYENAQDMVICELEKIVQKNEMSPSVLEYTYKIVDIIKDLDEAIMNEEERLSPNEGYSSRSGAYYNRGNSYRDGRVMYNDGYSRRGTSRTGNSYRGDSSKESMLDHLYMAHDTASSEEERKRIKRMIDEIENS